MNEIYTDAEQEYNRIQQNTFHLFDYHYKDSADILDAIINYINFDKYGSYKHEEVTILTGVGGMEVIADNATKHPFREDTYAYKGIQIHLRHDPLLDNMMVNGFPLHPQTGFPLSSYRYSIFGKGLPLAIFKVKRLTNEELGIYEEE